MGERTGRGAGGKSVRMDAVKRGLKGHRWTRKAQETFFAELALTANISHSAERAGMTGHGAHQRRRSDPAFAARWLEALDEGYAALEMLMLDQSLNGAERTETVTDADGNVKQRKSVRTFPHAIAVRLLQSHRETVERYRAMEMMRGGGSDPERVQKIRDELERVRMRLAEPEIGGAPDDEGGGDD